MRQHTALGSLDWPPIFLNYSGAQPSVAAYLGTVNSLGLFGTSLFTIRGARAAETAFTARVNIVLTKKHCTDPARLLCFWKSEVVVQKLPTRTGQAEDAPAQVCDGLRFQ